MRLKWCKDLSLSSRGMTRASLQRTGPSSTVRVLWWGQRGHGTSLTLSGQTVIMRQARFYISASHMKACWNTFSALGSGGHNDGCWYQEDSQGEDWDWSMREHLGGSSYQVGKADQSHSPGSTVICAVATLGWLSESSGWWFLGSHDQTLWWRTTIHIAAESLSPKGDSKHLMVSFDIMAFNCSKGITGRCGLFVAL